MGTLVTMTSRTDAVSATSPSQPGPNGTRSYYDALGEAEDNRLRSTIAGRVSFEVHRRFLARFLREGDRVLEIGAGPGRFTTALADLGASVVVADLSPVQLDLNRQLLSATAADSAVERREIVDVCDTSRYADGEFDLVLAYGGPLSYAFEAEQDAVAGLLRITRPGGYVVASVMSLLGTWRHHLDGVVRVAERVGEDVNDRLLDTGDMRHLGEAANHQCRMFRSEEIHALAASVGAQVVAMSASNWATLGHDDVLAPIEADPDRWTRFLDHEVRACATPGALDGGTHIMFALTRPAEKE
ncbi:methyltransferase domain protein [Nocardioidaceae bacterium Broad-1]|nr:methyltransferase domain protein [Nocardioidaceae bacterium Broad-1]